MSARASVRVRAVLKGSGRIVTASIPDLDPLREGIKNQAPLPVYDYVAYVKLRGRPVVLTQIGDEKSNFQIPGVFMEMLAWLRAEAFPRLSPYSRNDS